MQISEADREEGTPAKLPKTTRGGDMGTDRQRTRPLLPRGDA